MLKISSARKHSLCLSCLCHCVFVAPSTSKNVLFYVIKIGQYVADIRVMPMHSVGICRLRAVLGDWGDVPSSLCEANRRHQEMENRNL